MSRPRSKPTQRGEVVFPRFGHKRVGYRTTCERNFLLLSRQRSDIVDLDRSPIVLVLPHSGRSTLRPSYLVRRATGDRELVVVGRRKNDLPRLSPTVQAIASAAGFELCLFDAPALARKNELDDANLIEAGGTRRLPDGWTRTGYEALYTGSPESIAELKAMLPEGVDALAVALKLAWLGEITFEGHGRILSDRRFRHTPVRAAMANAAATTHGSR